MNNKGRQRITGAVGVAQTYAARRDHAEGGDREQSGHRRRVRVGMLRLPNGRFAR